MKRVFESGASKWKMRIVKDKAVMKKRTITSFALFTQHSQEASVIQPDGLSVNSDISLTEVTEVHSTASLDTGNRVCREQIIKKIDLTLREQTNPNANQQSFSAQSAWNIVRG